MAKQKPPQKKGSREEPSLAERLKEEFFEDLAPAFKEGMLYKNITPEQLKHRVAYKAQQLRDALLPSTMVGTHQPVHLIYLFDVLHRVEQEVYQEIDEFVAYSQWKKHDRKKKAIEDTIWSLDYKIKHLTKEKLPQLQKEHEKRIRFFEKVYQKTKSMEQELSLEESPPLLEAVEGFIDTLTEHYTTKILPAYEKRIVALQTKKASLEQVLAQEPSLEARDQPRTLPFLPSDPLALRHRFFSAALQYHKEAPEEVKDSKEEVTFKGWQGEPIRQKYGLYRLYQMAQKLGTPYVAYVEKKAKAMVETSLDRGVFLDVLKMVGDGSKIYTLDELKEMFETHVYVWLPDKNYFLSEHFFRTGYHSEGKIELEIAYREDRGGTCCDAVDKYYYFLGDVSSLFEKLGAERFTEYEIAYTGVRSMKCILPPFSKKESQS